MRIIRSATRHLFAGAALLAAMTVAAQAEEEKEVHIYNWADYIGKTTIADFEKETGIKVVYDTYDASETVDAKLLAGNSGYDVVLHSGNFIPKLIEAGIFLKLDRSKLTGWHNLDPKILKVLANFDAGNEHAVPYMWGTAGFTYNVDMIKARMPDAPMSSLDMIFKPELAKKWADCGISLLDSPTDVIPMALAYLGKDPTSSKPADYDAVVELFKPIRQYIKTFDSANYLNALPNKEVCVVNDWSGDYATATERAKDAGVEINLQYFVPDTGAPAWFDCWLIPSDAPHPENAYRFIDYMLRPEVIAAATNFTYYANANAAATPFVEKEILDDPAIYPTDATLATLWTDKPLDKAAQRARTRAWTKIKTGQ